jgi:TIR domain.
MVMALTPSNPPEVFISYSHKDEDLVERLEVYLKVLQNQKIITVLHSHRDVPGVDYAKEIEKNLSTAQIVLLLVSVDFLASYYCYRIEFERAMERHEQHEAFVIPVILRPSSWEDTPLGKLQALPKGGKPVVKWDDINDAFLSITDGIKQVVKRITPRPPSITRKITITIDESHDRFDQEGFREGLYHYVGVDLRRITITFKSGSVKILIEGDNEELARIVNALSDPIFQRQLFPTSNLRSISYIQDQQKHIIAIRTLTPVEMLRKAIRAFPAVKYTLLLAGIAAGLAVVEGFSSDYKIAVFGSITILLLISGLVWSSWLAIHSIVSIRRFAATLTWIFVLLTAVTALCILTGFFYKWPRSLEAYVQPRSTPSPIALPTSTLAPSPTSTVATQDVRIIITEVPPYDPVGDRNSQAHIAGKVLGVRPEDYSIVIYSLTNVWYVQPATIDPKTQIGPDGTWEADIHSGTRYAILLVPRTYEPPDRTSQSPTRLSGVVTSEEIEGKR